MKIINNTILVVVFSILAIFALSGCGSSGVASNNDLVGEGTLSPQVSTAPIITVHQGSTAVVHSHVTPATNGTTYTHQWTQVSGPTVLLSTPTASTTTVSVPLNATQAIILQHTVMNANTGQTTVTPHILTPVASTSNLDAIVSKTVIVVSGSIGSLHVSASGGDGQYSYAWTQTSGTTVTLNTTHPSAPTFTAPTVNSTETLVFQVMVKDGSGSAVGSEETITVTPATPKPLSLTVTGNNSTVKAGDSITLTSVATGGDPKATYVYNWYEVSDPSNPIEHGPDFIISGTETGSSFLKPGDKIHYLARVTASLPSGVDETKDVLVTITIK